VETEENGNSYHCLDGVDNNNPNPCELTADSADCHLQSCLRNGRKLYFGRLVHILFIRFAFILILKFVTCLPLTSQLFLSSFFFFFFLRERENDSATTQFLGLVTRAEMWTSRTPPKVPE